MIQTWYSPSLLPYADRRIILTCIADRNQIKANSKKIRVWNIRKVEVELGPKLCPKYFFMQCWVATQRLAHSDLARLRHSWNWTNMVSDTQEKVFDDSTSTAHAYEIQRVGENALVMLYVGKKEKSFDALCYQNWPQKAIKYSPETSFLFQQHTSTVSSVFLRVK